MLLGLEKLRASAAGVRARGQALSLLGAWCKQRDLPVNPLPARASALERASVRSRTEPRFGLALGIPHCPTNGLRAGRRDAPLLRGSARDRDGSPELLHHQRDAPLGLPLAVCARYLREQMPRLANPSIQNDG